MDDRVESEAPEAQEPLLDEPKEPEKPLLEETAETEEPESEGPVKALKDISRTTWSPYFAGLGLGVTLLIAFWFLGTGLGASGGVVRFAAWVWHGIVPNHVAGSAYFGKWFRPGSSHVLHYYLVFMVVGIFIGGLLSALGSGRIQPMVERGPRISSKNRLWLALAGGILVGFASRLARGCTSGQALTGTAMLLTGSVLFLVCMFIGGYAVAFFVRREWL